MCRITARTKKIILNYITSSWNSKGNVQSLKCPAQVVVIGAPGWWARVSYGGKYIIKELACRSVFSISSKHSEQSKMYVEKISCIRIFPETHGLFLSSSKNGYNDVKYQAPEGGAIYPDFHVGSSRLKNKTRQS